MITTIPRLTRDDLNDILQGMGDVTPQVASTLIHNGIKGKKHSPCDCPIANYLRYRGFTNVWVFGHEVDTDQGIVKTPFAIRYFLDAFDHRELWSGLVC